MTDATPPVPRTWGPGAPPPPGRPRRVRLLLVLLAFVALTGVGLGLLYWFGPHRAPAAVAVWITAEPGGSGVVPWAAQDRAALADAGVLGRTVDDPGPNPNRDQVRLRFRALARVRPSEPMVVTLVAPASVDAAGGVYILPADALGDHPRNRLPLAELLGYVRDCPSRHKLLVLQLTAPPGDPLFAPPPGELSAAVFRSLEQVEDANRLCLVACGPGEEPHATADLGRSAFGYYLEAGLRGLADGWGGDRDGRVTVAELAAFVRSRVSRWATVNLTTPQTPVLVGTAPDFPLSTYSRARLIDRYPVPPAGGEPEAGASAFSFPHWLRAGWERHDQWLTDGRASAAPRAFALLRAALLATERDWLGGRPAGEVQAGLDARLAELDKLAAALAAVPTPDPVPTLAAMFPGYAPPDPTVVRDLREAVLRADVVVPAPAAAAPADKPAGPPALPPEFDPFKAKPAYPELALAAFLVLTEDTPPSATRVKNLARLLMSRDPSPRFAEVLLIRRLADLADPLVGGSWSRERAGLALQVARDLEDAAARPAVLAWAKPALDDAYRLRADAEAVLFAPGFAPPEEAGRRLQLAAAAARQAKAFADRLHSAAAMRDEAVRWATGGTRLVTAGIVNRADALALADAARQLADALTPAAPLTTTDLATRSQRWQESEAAVRDALATVSRPLAPAALAKLRDRAETGTADPGLRAELDAVLDTPLVPAPQRAALWNARATLSRRLADEAVRRDAADDEAFRRGSASPEVPNPRDVPAAGASAEDVARRVAWSVAVMRLGGAATEATAVEADLKTAAGNPATTAARLRRAWLDELPAAVERPGGARLALVLPPVADGAGLDSSERNPDAVARRASARGLWAWQAARFTYETRDPVDPLPTDAGLKFTSSAARACAAVGGPPAEPYLDIATGPEPALTAKTPRALLDVGLRLIGTAGPAAVAVRVLSPAPEWLRIDTDGSVNLGPIREERVRVPIEAGPRPYLHPESRGVLVEAAVAGGRTYHRRTPVGLDSLVNKLDLVARPFPAGPGVRAIELRPNGEPIPYQLFLENPTTRPRKVIARLVGTGRETGEITVEPGKSAALVFPPPPPVAMPIPVPPAPAPKGPPPEPVYDPIPGGQLAVEIREPGPAGRVVDLLFLPVRALDPSEYVKVDDATGVRFRPAVGSRPNRLEVDLVPGKIVGPPCPVRVSLPPDRNPGIVKVRDASLSGLLPPDGRPLTLYTEATAFAGTGGVPAVVTIDVDRCERVYTFAGLLPPVGGTVRLSPVTEPMIRVKARPAPPEGKEPPPLEPGQPEPPYVEPVFVSGLQPLPVELEVDNAPPGSTVELRVGTVRPNPQTGEAEFLTDLAFPADPTRNPLPAKERGAGMRFDPKGEVLLLRATLRDPRARLPLEFVIGERLIEAWLIGPDGKPVTTPDGEPVVGQTVVVFDGTPPTNVRFVGLPPRVRKDQPLAVRATCDPTVSGLKSVKFFIGKPAGNAPPEGAPTVPGVPLDPKGVEWGAALPVAGLPERVTVGVQFVTRAGNAAVATQEVELVDPALLNKPEPGTITGRVTDNRIPQPKLKVFLYDAAAKPLRDTTTDDNGVFTFKAVPPGTYFLYAYNELTRREDKRQVDVGPGETKAQNLELLLGGAVKK